MAEHWPADATPHGIVALYGALFVTGLCALTAIGFYLLPRGQDWAARTAHLMRRPWDLRDVALVVVTLLLLQALILSLMWVLRRWGRYELFDTPYAWVVMHSIALHWAALLCIGLALRRKGEFWSNAFGASMAQPWWKRIGQAVWIYAATMPVLMTLTIAYQWWLESTGYTPAPQDVIQLFTELDRGLMYAYFIFLAVVLAPVSEELLFRGMLLPALAKRYGLLAAVLVHTVLFALLHLHIPSLLPLCILSVTLSLAYLYTGSIAVPILIHMIFNAVSLLAMVLLTA